MDKIAFIIGEKFIYWSPILLALAAAAAVCVYAAMYVKKSGNAVALFVSVLMSVLFSLPIARLIHWYLRSDAYESLAAAFTDLSVGSYALMGVFFGCLLAAVLVRILKISDNMAQMLDCMAIAAGVGIAIGRLSSLFNTTDRGMLLPEVFRFPFSYPVMNAVSGASENRMATFMLQSVLTGLIVTGLLIYMGISYTKKKRIPDGDIFLLFLLTYCPGQIVLDSTRYDSLYFPINRFVSVVQILGLTGMLIPIIIFSIRAVKSDRLRPKHFVVWFAMLLLTGLAGLSEYYVQRRGDDWMLAYSIMSCALIVSIVLTVLLRKWCTRKVQVR